MRLRFLALGCGVGAAIALATFLPRAHPGRITEPAAPADLSSGRAPSGQAIPQAGPDYCHSLYRMICQKQGVTRDPTGTVRPDVDGEVLALRLYEDIIREHRDWSSDQVDEELARQIYTPKVRARMTEAFKWVRTTLERIIERQPSSVLSAAEKHKLKATIHSVELQLPPPASLYADEPDLLTKNDVFYERVSDGTRRLRIGGAYVFTAHSYFNLVFTMGHELSHSIDPCEVRATTKMMIPAYDRLSSCFLGTGIVARRKDRHECGAKDQLSEVFADWLGTQVTAEALRQFSAEFHGPQLLGAVTNAVRDLCEPDAGSDDEVDLELHPSPEVRIDRIMGYNPEIREILGCPALPPQETCAFEPKAGTHL